MPSLKSLLETLSSKKLKETTPVVRTSCAVLDASDGSQLQSSWVKTASGWSEQGTSPGQHLSSEGQDVFAGSHVEKHGHMGLRTWSSPKLVTFCQVQARPGYRTCEAHEYLDEPSVLSEKAVLLASLLKKSRSTILYTGAGISTASGIPDHATRSSNGVIGQSEKAVSSSQISPLCAKPTKAHRILVALYQAGLIKGWVQQNHDGLPQKAGLPQSAINEIHGAWFDPSNPVVQMKGQLRGDLFASLLEWERDADLCLALGTSLAGMNADRVAVSCGERGQQGAGLGTVIVNLQRTTQDHLAALRVFAPIDDLLEAVARELRVPPEAYADPPAAAAPRPDLGPAVCAQAEGAAGGDVWTVPYDASGRRTGGGAAGAGRALDLREGARVRVTAGPYGGDEGVVRGRRRDGHYDLVVEHRVSAKLTARVPLLLGAWFVDAAVAGALPAIPVVTVAPADSATGGADPAGGVVRAAAHVRPSAPERRGAAAHGADRPAIHAAGSHFSGLWIGEARPDADLEGDVPTNPIRWALSLRCGAAVSAVGAGYFDDAADVPGEPVLLFALRGSLEPDGAVRLVKTYDAAVLPDGPVVEYRGRLGEADGRPALTGTWTNAREGTRGAFACRLEENPAAAAAAVAAVAPAAGGHCSGMWIGEARPDKEFERGVPTNPIRWALSLCCGAAVSAVGAGYFDDAADVPGEPVLLFALRGSLEPDGAVRLVKKYDAAVLPDGPIVEYRGRLGEAGGRPALTGTWTNAREGTRGAFACRLEEDPRAAAAPAGGGC